MMIQAHLSPTILTVPGLMNSGPRHWQALWESGLHGFAPLPHKLLPFASILVASHNDDYMTLERSRILARTWGSQFADAGEAGHINADSGLGDWRFGQFLLSRLTRRLVTGSADERRDISLSHRASHDATTVRPYRRPGGSVHQF